MRGGDAAGAEVSQGGGFRIEPRRKPPKLLAVLPLVEIPDDRPALLIPDVHQDMDFFKRAVEYGRRESAVLVFLGDYVDSINPRWRSPAAQSAIATALPELARTYSPGCVFHVGNHDMQALRIARYRSALRSAGHTAQLAQLDATLPEAAGYAELLDLWPEEFLRTWRIASHAHGFLLSHAGVARLHWPWLASRDASAQTHAFLAQAAAAWESWVLDNAGSPLFEVGPGRGGTRAPVGGPLWLDWESEFVDDLPWPQIVGHTRGASARHKDRSWCIDCAQTVVAVLDPDFGLRVVPL